VVSIPSAAGIGVGDIVKDLVGEIVVAEEITRPESEKEFEVEEYLFDLYNLDEKEEDKIDLAFV